MKLHVHLTGLDEPIVVEVLSDRGDRVELRVDGEPMTLDLADVAGRCLVTRDGGRVDLVDCLPYRDGWELLLGATAAHATVMDERDTWLGAAGAAHSAGDVTVAMPGKVVVVDVAVGQAVVAGQRLLVIEAMKMENDVTASGPGVVTVIHVAPGDAVESGQALVHIE